MIYLYIALFVATSALMWRIRGGLWKDYIPANKIWYAAAFALCGYFHFENAQATVVGFIASYVSYQLYGVGLYVGRLVNGGALNPNLIQYRECELIDDLLYSCRISFKGKTVWLYEYPRLFGFCGTTLTGLIITFLWGLYLGSIAIMLCGLGMGVCYWLGCLLNKFVPEKKAGWGYGEYIFGAYLGGWLAWVML